MTQVASAAVARPRKTPKKGSLYRMHVIVPAELVELVDRYAVQVKTADAMPATRTEAIRILLVEGLKRHGFSFEAEESDAPSSRKR